MLKYDCSGITYLYKQNRQFRAALALLTLYLNNRRF